MEDNPVIRQNRIATLEEMLPLRVLGSAEDERTAIDWMTSAGLDGDLMIIDFFLKSGTGLQVIRCQSLGAHRLFDKSAELDELLADCAKLAGTDA